MEKDALALKLDKLLEDYTHKITSLDLRIPNLEDPQRWPLKPGSNFEASLAKAREIAEAPQTTVAVAVAPKPPKAIEIPHRSLWRSNRAAAAEAHTAMADARHRANT